MRRKGLVRAPWILLILAIQLMGCLSTSEISPEEILPGMLRDEVLSLLKDTGIKGLSLAVVDMENGTWATGFGDADDKGTPVTEGTLFRPGSISKVFTAMGLILALEESNWNLDSLVGDILGEDFWGDTGNGTYNITPRHLLTHTSGLPADYLGQFFTDDPSSYQLTLEYLSEYENQYPPGEGWNYCNTAFALAGVLIHRITGVSFPEYMESRILSPWGMEQASFEQRASDPGQLSMGFLDTGIPFFSITDHEPLVWCGPAGGLAASARDMAQFMENYLSSAHPLDFTTEMEVSQLTENVLNYGRQMGLGWILDQGNPKSGRMLFHNGGTGMFFSFLKLLPDQGLGVYVSINSNSSPETATLVGERILGILLEDRPQSSNWSREEPATPWASQIAPFVGNFHHPHGILSLKEESPEAYVVNHPDFGMGWLKEAYFPNTYQIQSIGGERYHSLIVFFEQDEQKYLGELVGRSLSFIAPRSRENETVQLLDPSWLGAYQVKNPEKLLGQFPMEATLLLLEEEGQNQVQIQGKAADFRNLIIEDPNLRSPDGFGYRLAGYYHRYNGSSLVFRMEDDSQVVHWMGLKFER